MDFEAKSFGHGLRELGGAVDLINQYKLMPHYELFCRRSIPSSISETHYLHSVVGNLEICKGEGMELEQLFQDGKFLRKSDACIRPFNLNALDDAFHMRDATSVNLSLAEKGIPTTVAKVKSKLEEKVTKRKRLDSKDKTTKDCKKQKSLHKNKTYQKGKNSNFSSGSNLEDLKKQGEKLHEKERMKQSQRVGKFLYNSLMDSISTCQLVYNSSPNPKAFNTTAQLEVTNKEGNCGKPSSSMAICTAKTLAI